jgi:hypothetical protein
MCIGVKNNGIICGDKEKGYMADDKIGESSRETSELEVSGVEASYKLVLTNNPP